jgi:type II secretory ATPase GspE/PulE/Tfp pilus assembly ATPase PilB-like protein
MDTGINWNELDGPGLQKKLQEYCTSEGISDIHFAPEKTDVRLEIRLHGILEEISRLSHKTYQDYVRQIKFLSKLKLNVTNVPQDGHYTFEHEKRSVNIRVASIPSRFGEKFTLRILDPELGIVPLEQLGFDEEIYKKLSEIMQLPNGIFLITGPTGSGKTTTLYALLSTIVGKDRNIITLEDPVEYELPGIVQSQIDTDHDYTFASGLRSILRHDPDVILVGEIRDYETAQTAIDAALTGHLVLSTLHTNSAVEAIPRLLSMGVSPYTFAPALRAILAQRLVRTLKPECKGGKCDPSNNDSYSERTALPELLVATPAIRELIIQNETAETILAKAKEEGYRTMSDWGKILVERDETSETEILRVTM